MADRILVTGATGLQGGAVARRYSSDAISESRWAQRRGNFLSRPKEPHSDDGWRHIEHYTHFLCGVPLKPAEK